MKKEREYDNWGAEYMGALQDERDLLLSRVSKLEGALKEADEAVLQAGGDTELASPILHAIHVGIRRALGENLPA